MKIELIETPKGLKLEAPYHPALPAAARARGGKWKDAEKAWYFDPRDRDAMREIVKTIYGIDPDHPEDTELATVRLTLGMEYGRDPDTGKHFARGINTETSELWICGREVLNRQTRDSPVRLGDGVILLTGSFPSRGGSARYPTISAPEGTVIEVRDVPKPLAEQVVTDHPEHAEMTMQPKPEVTTNEKRWLHVILDEMATFDESDWQRLVEILESRRREKE